MTVVQRILLTLCLLWSGSASASLDRFGPYMFPFLGVVGGVVTGVGVALLKVRDVGIARFYAYFLFLLCLLAAIAAHSAEIFFWFLAFGGVACAPTFAIFFYSTRHVTRRMRQKSESCQVKPTNNSKE